VVYKKCFIVTWYYNCRHFFQVTSNTTQSTSIGTMFVIFKLLFQILPTLITISFVPFEILCFTFTCVTFIVTFSILINFCALVWVVTVSTNINWYYRLCSCRWLCSGCCWLCSGCCWLWRNVS
jgi:hypothetical protein